jgi:hypothetical protein
MRKLSYVFYLAFVITSCHDFGKAQYTDVEKLKIGMSKQEVEKILTQLKTFDRVNDSTYIYGYWAEHPNYMDYILKVTYMNGVAVSYNER